MTLRCGITTGTCAAAAAKAATVLLVGGAPVREVELVLPSGRATVVPIVRSESVPEQAAARAAVRKDAGDDPDVTDGLEIEATVVWQDDPNVTFVAGEGVGIVTKPGLQISPGEPAINPVPRRMVAAAIRTITPRGIRVALAIPGGREVAARTFNPRLGIEGGLSILGTSGIVRPYCREAMCEALKCSLDVAEACGITRPVLVAGNIGVRAARALFSLGEDQLLEVGNEWGFMLDHVAARRFGTLLILGHPGKLAKLVTGDWDTHSARSRPAVDGLRQMCREVLGCEAPTSPTAEGLLAALDGIAQKRLAKALARRIRTAVVERIGLVPRTAVVLINMAGACLAADGDLTPWK